MNESCSELRYSFSPFGFFLQFQLSPCFSPSPDLPTRCPRARDNSIQTLFALRPRLPSAVHPQPLLRILPHITFNHTGELLRVGHDVGLQIAGSHQLQRRIEAQPVLAD